MIAAVAVKRAMFLSPGLKAGESAMISNFEVSLVAISAPLYQDA
jgi:hypothetical protein